MASPSNISWSVGSLSLPQTGTVPLVRVRPASSERSRPSSVEARARDLVETHYELVWRAVRAFGVARDDADDAAQQVFIVASRRIDDIVPDSERAFLFTTARGIAANYRRSKARKPEILDEEAILAVLDDAPDVEEVLDDARAHALLDHVIAGLDDDLRAVFVLFELEEMSTAAIASILEIPVGTVGSRLRRARDEFHASVKRLRARARINGADR